MSTPINKVSVFSIDMDGCGIPQPVDPNRPLEMQVDTLVEHIVQKAVKSGATQIKLMIGSNRQDALTDWCNTVNDSGTGPALHGQSTLAPVMLLAIQNAVVDRLKQRPPVGSKVQRVSRDEFMLQDQYSSRPDNKNTFNSILELVDAYGIPHNRVSSASLVRAIAQNPVIYQRWQAQQPQVNSSVMHDCFTTHKAGLIQKQLTRVANQHSGDDVLFEFLDDSQTNLSSVARAANTPGYIPTNIQLDVTSYLSQGRSFGRAPVAPHVQDRYVPIRRQSPQYQPLVAAPQSPNISYSPYGYSPRNYTAGGYSSRQGYNSTGHSPSSPSPRAPGQVMFFYRQQQYAPPQVPRYTPRGYASGGC